MEVVTTTAALAISEKQLGPDHPSTGTSLNNLAGLYRSMGRYEAAEPLYNKALTVFLDRLLQDHPSVTNTFNGLANLIITAHQNGQTDRLSAHPMTQAILQQIQNAD